VAQRPLVRRSGDELKQIRRSEIFFSLARRVLLLLRPFPQSEGCQSGVDEEVACGFDMSAARETGITLGDELSGRLSAVRM
jgi:hypothetical protein